MSELNDETVAQQDSKSPNLVAVEKNTQHASKLNVLNLFDDKQLVVAEALLGKLMKSDKSGIKSVNDGLAMLMRAQELNLPFSTCIDHVHIINGKIGVDIHVIKALMTRAGCTWRCTKNYQPLYEYTDGFNVYVDGSFPDYVVRCLNKEEANERATKDNNDKVYVYPVKFYQDFNGNVYKDYQLSGDKFGQITNKAQAAAVVKAGKIPVFRIPNKPVDFITEYEITRKIAGKEVTTISSFSFSEATMAGMFEKDTYKKYPKTLIGHRAFTYGARDIASDVLFGCMETTELKIVSGKELSDKDVIDVDAEIIR